MSKFKNTSCKFIFLVLVACYPVICLNAQNASYQITNLPSTDQPVSPILYGGFFELGFGRSDNLWAELLWDRGFEGESSLKTNIWPKFSKDRAVTEENWWHSGYEEDLWYLRKESGDTSEFKAYNWSYWPAPYQGKYFANLDNKKGNEDLSLVQDGVYIRNNISHEFSGYFASSQHFTGDEVATNPVTIEICLFEEGNFSKLITKKKLEVNSCQFKKYHLTFSELDFKGMASIAVKVPAGKELRADLLSLMPSDNRKGWRKSVVELIKNEVRQNIIRFPGGCHASWYNWRDGIGSRDERPVDDDNYWNRVVLNDVGTGEFVDFCKAVNTLPMLCVPVMFGNEDDAAEWVAYCNKKEHPLRIKHGYTEPFDIKYWEMDNETYRLMGPISYAGKCVEFSKAMKAIDPSIKIIMGNYYVYHDKFKEMLDIAGPYIDIVTNRGGDSKQIAEDAEILKAYNRKNNTNIGIAHTELRAPLNRKIPGADNGLMEQKVDENETFCNLQTEWNYGLNVLNQFIDYQNMGGIFRFANFTNTSDGWGECLINAPKEEPFISSAGRAFQLLNKLDIEQPVKIKINKFDSDLVVQAAWNKEKSKFTLLILNYGDKKLADFDFRDLPFDFSGTQVKYVVFAADLKTYNSPEKPDNIAVEKLQSKIKKKKFQLKVEPFSATAYEFSVL